MPIITRLLSDLLVPLTHGASIEKMWGALLIMFCSGDQNDPFVLLTEVQMDQDREKLLLLVVLRNFYDNFVLLGLCFVVEFWVLWSFICILQLRFWKCKSPSNVGHCTYSYGSRSFRFKEPSDWNNVPSNIISISSFLIFNHALSSHCNLACSCFPWNCCCCVDTSVASHSWIILTLSCCYLLWYCVFVLMWLLLFCFLSIMWYCTDLFVLYFVTLSPWFSKTRKGISSGLSKGFN